MVVPINNEKKIFCYHGSPTSTIESISTNTLHTRLDELFRNLDTSFIVAAGGHTHEQLLRQHNHLLIINPGSVGCAFKIPLTPKSPPTFYPVAEYAIIEYKNGLSVNFRKIDFDVLKFINIVRTSDLPLKNWWESEFNKLGY